jgi:aminoglycoside phosphotransferase (APT) family kinase protein
MGELAAVRTLLGELADPGLRGLRIRGDGNSTIYLGTRCVVRVGRAWPLTAPAETTCWRVARAAGVPAPRYVAAGMLPTGATYVAYARESGVPVSGRVALRDAGAVLARLHRVDGRAFPQRQHSRPRRRNRYAIAGQELDRIGARSRPAAAAWLSAARQDWAEGRTVATHGDFRPCNLLAAGGRVGCVLDWSDARAASPESDLGQSTAADLPDLFAGYRRHAPGRLSFTLVAGHLLARHLALEAGGVLAPGSAAELVHRLTAGSLARLREDTDA